MNIEEYRAMKAQEAEAQTQPEGGTANVQADEGATDATQQAVQTPDAPSGAPETNPSQATTPPVVEEIEIDGTPVPVEELRQGYLRQSDYTRKTQELAQLKKQSEIAEQYFQAIHSDPEFTEGIARRFNLP